MFGINRIYNARVYVSDVCRFYILNINFLCFVCFTVKEVETRMKSIRTQYGRLGKQEPSGSAANISRPNKLGYKKNCSFLSPYLKKRNSQSNLNSVRSFILKKEVLIICIAFTLTIVLLLIFRAQNLNKLVSHFTSKAEKN